MYPIQLPSLSRLTYRIPHHARLREDSPPSASIRAPSAAAPPSVSPGLHFALTHRNARPRTLMGASPRSAAPGAPADASLLASCSLLTAAVPRHGVLSPTSAAACHQDALRVPITTAPHPAAPSPSIIVAVLGVPVPAALRDVDPSAA